MCCLPEYELHGGDDAEGEVGGGEGQLVPALPPRQEGQDLPALLNLRRSFRQSSFCLGSILCKVGKGERVVIEA